MLLLTQCACCSSAHIAQATTPLVQMPRHPVAPPTAPPQEGSLRTLSLPTFRNYAKLSLVRAAPGAWTGRRHINHDEKAMYVCPDCKGLLVDSYCSACHAKFGTRAGVREFLSRDARFASAAQISSTYDGIYTRRSQVWEDQGRTLQFISYFSDLAASCSTGRLLEIGCGEGYLLAQLRAAEKVAVDISAEALSKAGPRTGADCSVALAERLPFATASFDIVVSVGVMEHFLDDLQASAEICRVLKPSGWYLALIHVTQSYGQKAGQKLREYIYPSFRPLALVRWLGSKVYRPIYQPIQHGYTATSASACLAAGGFDVTRTISTATEPAAPLAGPHVVIYVARKRASYASRA